VVAAGSRRTGAAMTNAVMVWLRREAALVPAATVAANAGLGESLAPFYRPTVYRPNRPRRGAQGGCGGSRWTGRSAWGCADSVSPSPNRTTWREAPGRSGAVPAVESRRPHFAGRGRLAGPEYPRNRPRRGPTGATSLWGCARCGRGHR
jgi:hypothetical protein